MDCEEQSLREMLASPFGAGVAQSILDKVGRGEDVIIHFSDHSAVALSDEAEALRVLKEQFGWVAGYEGEMRKSLPTEDMTAARVLDMCQRMERGFTLKEIVARVLDERPEIILDFANAWARLIRNRRIRVLQSGEPCLYAVC
jgi:hypothetical protein